MTVDTATPVIAGLAAGIALVLVFAVFGHESLASIGRLSVSLATPDGGVRPEYNLQINKIDNDTLLARNDIGVLKHLIENAPAYPYYDQLYADEITNQEAKQLMKILQFSNITSYVDPTFVSDDFRVYMALVQMDGGEKREYYRIFIQTSKLPDNELSTFNIIQATPPLTNG